MITCCVIGESLVMCVHCLEGLEIQLEIILMANEVKLSNEWHVCKRIVLESALIKCLNL